MDIFTTALGLTKQINGFELAGYLIDRIEQEFKPVDTDVFEVYGVPGNYSEQDVPDEKNITVRRFNYTGNIQRKTSDLTEFHQAILSGNPLIVNDEDNELEKIVIPVPSKCGPLRLVVVSGIDECGFGGAVGSGARWRTRAVERICEELPKGPARRD